MYVLGINGGLRPGHSEISAALIHNGRVVSAIEEERLNRIKHTAFQLPELSIHFVLNYQKITMHDVDYIASHGITRGDGYVKQLKDFIEGNFGYCPPIEMVHHHDAHSASTYYASGFDEAMIISMDASGDSCSTELSVGKGKNIDVIERYERQNSVGIFYSMITQYCGFERSSGEYKLMGLSSYGNGKKFDFNDILRFENGKIFFNTDYIKPIIPSQPQVHKQEFSFSEKLVEKFGKHRMKTEPITQRYKDIAASCQQQLEKVVIELVTNFHETTGLRKLCLAGGVALNCVVNQRLMNLEFIDDIYIQPASGDSGISLGAAYLVAKKHDCVLYPMETIYLGPEYSNDIIKSSLDTLRVSYEYVDDPDLVAADRVSQNKVVGWFQGKMELGPRALGNRSILANPMNSSMKDIVNQKIKFRESFRPFCPSVLEEEFEDYFSGKKKTSPHMTITYDVKESAIEKIPAVTHVDNTARIQTVNKIQNELFYNYLLALKKIIGIGVSLNTSFNISNQPIVNTPIEAISTFFGTGMDCLVIGNYLLEK